MTVDEIKAKADDMRLSAQYADDYGTWQRETDAANAWEARQLQTASAQ